MILQESEKQAYIGKQVSQTECLSPIPTAQLNALLSQGLSIPSLGSTLPHLGIWLHFQPIVDQAFLASDGHPKLGDFLPPISDARRMWAGSQLSFHRPLHIGDVVSKVSTIESIQVKEGKSGSLIFVKVCNEFIVEGELAVQDKQDIVYRPMSTTPAPVSTGLIRQAPTDSCWEQEVSLDPVALFRYSAATFNSHRIHYDRSYATEVEHYPGLVVHGPLQATLLLNLLLQHVPNAQVSHYQFKAVKPSFDGQKLVLCGQVDSSGRRVHLWIKHLDGALAMQAQVELAQPISIE